MAFLFRSSCIQFQKRPGRIQFGLFLDICRYRRSPDTLRSLSRNEAGIKLVTKLRVDNTSAALLPGPRSPFQDLLEITEGCHKLLAFGDHALSLRQ